MFVLSYLEILSGDCEIFIYFFYHLISVFHRDAHWRFKLDHILMRPVATQQNTIMTKPAIRGKFFFYSSIWPSGLKGRLRTNRNQELCDYLILPVILVSGYSVRYFVR